MKKSIFDGLIENESDVQHYTTEHPSDKILRETIEWAEKERKLVPNNDPCSVYLDEVLNKLKGG